LVRLQQGGHFTKYHFRGILFFSSIPKDTALAIRLRRTAFEKETGHSWWEHIKFQLFGEWKIVGWIIGIGIVGAIFFWSLTTVIVGHFVSKYW
jgi:hypothetical protein